jgi:hypothetical protein
LSAIAIVIATPSWTSRTNLVYTTTLIFRQSTPNLVACLVAVRDAAKEPLPTTSTSILAVIRTTVVLVVDTVN